MMYSSFQDVISRGRTHRCMHKLILSLDNPLLRRIGFVCDGCGEEWETTVMGIKTNPPSSPGLRLLLNTIDGRLKLARMMTCDGAVYVWQEEAV